ncbi:MAG: OmpA family protein [Psychroflexus sp.]|nr:OmpA family protein [Psychroflexus sp.]
MKSIYLILPMFLLLSSCVSKKKFDDINSRLLDMENAKANLEELVDKKNYALDSLTDIIQVQEQKLDSLADQNKNLEDDLVSKQKAFENLKSSYDALEKQSSASLAANSKQNRELLAELEEKREMLNEKQSRLSGLQKDLNKREERIRRLEERIAQKEQQMNQLKQNLQKALVDFEGKGLEVEQRNGNVYVSMENKLLFGSGSWNVGSQGKKAIQELSKVLANNPDINVLIEGHTDNVPYKGNEMIEDNWDLSTKRATEVLKLILSSSSIDAQGLTAAGRGKFMPVASNETEAGRAKNRRIEVVLSPKLSNLSEMINNME